MCTRQHNHRAIIQASVRETRREVALITADIVLVIVLQRNYTICRSQDTVCGQRGCGTAQTTSCDSHVMSNNVIGGRSRASPQEQ